MGTSSDKLAEQTEIKLPAPLAKVHQIAAILCFFILSFFLLWIPSRILSFLPRQQRDVLIKPLWGLFARIMTSYIFLAKVTSFDFRTEEEKNKQVLVISNHLSVADIPLFITHQRVGPLMKSEVLKLPFFGYAGVIAGAVPLDRKCQRSRQDAFKKMKALIEIPLTTMYFPEGTRSRSGKPKDLSEIKTRIMAVAYENKVPVAPLSILGTDKLVDNRLNLRPFSPVGIVSSKYVYPEDYSNLEDFNKECWKRVCAGFKLLSDKMS